MNIPQYTLTTFTPGEAERITGLSTTMQRDWRRRDILPTTHGHARFDVFELAEMWVLKLLTDRGIGPQAAMDVAPQCAAGIVLNALQWVDAYEGDHLRTFEWLPPDERPQGREVAPEVLHVLKRVATETPPDELPPDFLARSPSPWGPKAKWLAGQILHLKGIGEFIDEPFFIWWADGTCNSCSLEDLRSAFGDTSFEDRYAGPAIVLHLKALANTLAGRVGRPLVHVEFEADPKTGELLPPVEFGAPVPLSSK
jgi:hypothetical protein